MRPDSRLKIAFSSYDSIKNPFYGGGGARAIHEIAQRLAEDWEVEVFAGSFPGSADEVLDGVSYKFIGPAPRFARFGQLLFHACLPLQARRGHQQAWVESLTPPLSTACLQLFTAKPVALLTQLLPGKAMWQKYHLPFHWIESLGLKTYRYGIALTPAIATDLRARNPRLQTIVIPNGVRQDLIDQQVEPEGGYGLFLGRIDVTHKGLDLLVEAVRRTKGARMLEVVIAGAGLPGEENRLRQLVSAPELRGHFKLAGHVSGERKAELLRKAAFMVMPSRYEGLPLALLEAFCWRLPVVMFDIPDFEFVPRNCACKISPFDLDAFAATLVRLSQDSLLRRQVGDEAKVFVRGFGWNEVAQRYRDFLIRIMADHNLKRQ